MTDSSFIVASIPLKISKIYRHTFKYDYVQYISNMKNDKIQQENTCFKKKKKMDGGYKAQTWR